MSEEELDARMIAIWRKAAEDLGIRVTTPVELKDGAGKSFMCEALVHDFGSPGGAVSISRKTERRVRQNLRNFSGDLWRSGGERVQPAKYVRKQVIDQLVDWGWFGREGGEPDWYLARRPRS